MLAPRAEEHEISAVSRHLTGRVRAHIGAFGQRINTAYTTQELAGTLNGIAVACGARPVPADASLSGRIARMVDPAWWRRNLRRGLLRENEAIEHAQARIRRKGQCYVSDHAMQRARARTKANAATLARLEVANEEGQAFNLADVSDASISNPALRRSELMVRCCGFEETAVFTGDDAVLLTITCPSRFHRFGPDGSPNKNWKGATPKQGQEYLCKVWRKIGAAWGRAGLFPYGFRVVEPHHDGCPHWHVLLFAPKEKMGWFAPARLVAGRKDHGAGLIGIAGAYAMQDTPAERGAVKHRYTAKRIDPAKGGATGYIAKYISKNIDGRKEDGTAVGLDYASGTSAEKGARRVRTWAQTWGIRQFQQVGGPSVTVWRELRRLGKDLEQPLQLDMFEGPRAAADRSLWSLFWVLQGGPEVRRKDLTLKPWYVDDIGQKYGDESKRVYGVECTTDGQGMCTRLHKWTVQRAGLADVDWHESERWEQRGVDANLDAWAQAAGLLDAEHFREFERREATPWTRVNNCTDPLKSQDEADVQADFLRSMWAAGPEYPRRVGHPESKKEKTDG